MQQHIDINVLILRLKSSEFCPSQHPWSKRNTTYKSCCCAAYRGQRVCRADLSLLRQDIHRNDSCYDAIYCKNACLHQCTYICTLLPTNQLTPRMISQKLSHRNFPTNVIQCLVIGSDRDMTGQQRCFHSVSACSYHKLLSYRVHGTMYIVHGSSQIGVAME